MTDEPKQLPGYGHAYQRLIELGPEKMAILEGKMAKAEPSHMLADLIQKTWGLCKDVERKTLARQIARYRNTMVTPKMAIMYEAAAGKPEAMKAKAILEKQLSVVDEMMDLLDLQKERMQKVIEFEADKPSVLMQNLDQAIDLRRKIIMDLANLQMETGQVPRAARATAIQGKVTNPDGSSSTFQVGMIEQQVPAIRKEVQAFIALIDQQVGYGSAVPAHPAAIGHSAEGDHHSPQ